MSISLIVERKLRAGGFSVSFVFSRDVVGGEVTCEEVFADYDDIGTDVVKVEIGKLHIIQKTFLTIMKTCVSMVIMYTVVAAIPSDIIESLKKRKTNNIDDCKEEMLKEKAVCEDRMTQECEACHTIYIKDCTITMKRVVTPVKVKKCMTKMRGNDGQCGAGVRKKCSIR